MLQDKNNLKNCDNCIHTTHWSQVRQLSISRIDPCYVCDYPDYGEWKVPSQWEERFSEREIKEYNQRISNR